VGNGKRRELRLERVLISELKLDSRNPRLHSDRQIKQIAGSIKAFGFNVPVLVDDDCNVVAGHGRIYAALKLGLPDIPAIRLEHLTSTQARAFAIADNRLSEMSTWDDRLLGEVLRDLAAIELDFNIEATGFSMGEIDFHIEGLSVSTGNAADPADQLPKLADQPPISRAGDLWQMGRHRLLCGDALEADAFDRLMQNRRAQVVFTDPPYNVPIDGHVSGKGQIHHREFQMASGEMTAAQFTWFLTKVLQLLAGHSTAGSLHFVCMDWRHQLELLTAAEGVYSELKNLCIWVKDNAGMGSLYRSQHELVFVFKNGRVPHRNNVELGRYGRNRTNVWHYPNVGNFGRGAARAPRKPTEPTNIRYPNCCRSLPARAVPAADAASAASRSSGRCA
jgi:hypothetical protein